VLVFTRRRNEAIIVADGIEIRVLRVSRDAVRLGVTAPPDVPVHRHEIYEQIREENCRAAQGGTDPAAAGVPDALVRIRAGQGGEG
jgi:carbon storage regulator